MHVNVCYGDKCLAKVRNTEYILFKVSVLMCQSFIFPCNEILKILMCGNLCEKHKRSISCFPHRLEPFRIMIANAMVLTCSQLY
jgi:hypothetical protein